MKKNCGYAKGTFNHVSRIRLKESNFSFTHAMPLLKQRNAMINCNAKQSFPLCLNTFCHKKQVILAYLLFLYSYHIITMVVFTDDFHSLFNCRFKFTEITEWLQNCRFYT